MSESLWRKDAAILRLVSAVEAFTNAASDYWFEQVRMPPPSAPFTWPARVKHYRREHNIDLSALPAWKQVEAGVDLRNCLAHGLGQLTPQLARDERIVARMKSIDVVVAGSMMRLGPETVSKLTTACVAFVRAVEAELVSSLP